MVFVRFALGVISNVSPILLIVTLTSVPKATSLGSRTI